jgi:hypothetical protein
MDQRKNPGPGRGMTSNHTSQMRHIIADFCRKAVEDYRDAGCPLGRSVDSMLIWFEYGQKTTQN